MSTLPDRVPLAWLAHALDRRPEFIQSAISRGTFPILPVRVLGRVYFERADADALLRGDFDSQPARERAASITINCRARHRRSPAAGRCGMSMEFRGTGNPRYLRVLALLLARPARREEIDRAAGALNGPDLMANLRALGLEAPCTRVDAIDRDGRECRPGVYRLTGGDRRRLAEWMRGRHVRLPPVTPDLFGDGGAS